MITNEARISNATPRLAAFAALSIAASSLAACGDNAANALDPSGTLGDEGAAFGVEGDGDGLEWGKVLFEDAVSVGGDTSGRCHVDSSGTVLCSGNNEDGQLGNGLRGGTNGVPESATTDSAVVGIDDAVEVYATSLTQRCALTKAGSLVCWGNLGGQVSAKPVVIGPPEGAGRAVAGQAVYAGQLVDALALLTHESKVCILRFGTVECRQVVPDATSIAVSKTLQLLTLHVLDARGDVFACSLVDFQAPCEQLALPAPATQLTTFDRLQLDVTGLALLEDGRVACWGWCPLGDPVDLTAVPETAPSIIPGLSDVERLVGGTCTIDRDDTVYCWGGGVRKNDNNMYTRPERIGTLPGLEQIVGADARGIPTLGITSSGQARAISWP